MLNLTVFVSRLKQAIAWNMNLSQSPVEFAEYSDFYSVENCRQVLHTALLNRESHIIPLVSTAHNFRELGRILCIEVVDGASSWDNIWCLDERVVLLVDTWFALDEFPKNHEAILYCWIPKAFELAVQKAMSLEPPSKLFWLDKQPNMFYNAVILAMAELE